MIRYLTDPEFLTDAELLREFCQTNDEGDRAKRLLAEIKRRRLDC